MVQCEQCGASGLKMREVMSAYSEGRTILVCRACAKNMLGEQEPEMYVKRIERKE